MQKEIPTIQIFTKCYREYSLKFKSCLSYIACNDIFKLPIKRTYIKLLFICLLIMMIYFFLNPTIMTTKPITIQSKSSPPQVNAIIITANCSSLRFYATKENIERVFPNFFNISCYLFVPLEDPRIHPVDLSILKRFSSNLITFIDLWTYEISKNAKNELDWTFIFEDDVNFNDPSKVSLPNYNAPLQDLMNNPEVLNNHGFIYLGICGPSFDNNTQPLISKNTNNNLTSHKGCGFCLHASGITVKRSRLFWTEVSSYRPAIDGSLDKQIHDFCLRSTNHFYTFGTNFLYPPGTGHYGICYQDRGRFSSTVV